MALIDKAKVAMRITTTVYDSEITDLIAAAQSDLGIAGVTLPPTLDEICERAIITYCRMNFSMPEGSGTGKSPYDRLKASYDEQKAQLSMATGYTTW